MKTKAYIELLDENNLPFYAHPGDAGMDIRAAKDIILMPRQIVVVPTGIKIAVNENVVIDVRPRSGLSLKTPLRVANTPGTIDSKYRDEIGVIIQNISLPFKYEDGKLIDNEDVFDLNVKEYKEGIYKINKGDKIAQLVFSEFLEAELEKIDDIKKIEGDRGGGYGHSGIK